MDSQASVSRISILGVPVDTLPEDRIDEIVAKFEDGKNHQIILLSVWDLMKARREGEFRTMVAGASLVLPISLSIVKGAHFLRKPEPVRYMPFDFAIKLLAALERRGKSLYILGSSRSSVQKAEANIKSTFPGLRVVGRFAGHYPRHMEGAIIEAVRKATPNLLMVGSGVPGRERWIPRNLSHFNAGIYLWCSDLFEVFAEKRAKPSRQLFAKGLEWIPYLIRRPWNLYRILTILHF
ncbi:MAG TPA: WecB/TagA/CpsF family glycosyltransferase, partial [Rectinemataceae bacterium]|nr:WecB/TagA/CpsF family glycosyltransferase [Rectinemataceae bacterium]